MGALSELYRELAPSGAEVFIVPRRQRERTLSDYLSLLYVDWDADETHPDSKSDLNSEFPLTDLSLAAHIRLVTSRMTGRVALLHYHWFEFQSFPSALGMIYRWACISLFHALGGHIIWTVHNLQPHQGRWKRANRWISRRLALKADRILAHCGQARDQIAVRFGVPAQTIRVHPHPSYPVTPIAEHEALERLSDNFGITLNPERPRFLCFGHIAAYKQLDVLVSCILEAAPQCQILIAGQPKPDSGATMRALASMRNTHPEGLFLLTDWIPDEELASVFGSCSVCVFHHREILASGGVHMALAFSKPVIAPRKGCISELAPHPLLHLFETSQELRELLSRGVWNA